MNFFQQDGFFEEFEQFCPSLGMSPDWPQMLRAGCIRHLRIAEADVFDGFQLAEIADEYDADVAKSM